VQSTSTASPHDGVPNPYSVPGCTCLADESAKLFRGKAQSRFSLGTIYRRRRDKQARTSKRAYEAREEKFARIPIYTSRLAAEKARASSRFHATPGSLRLILSTRALLMCSIRDSAFLNHDSREAEGDNAPFAMTHSPCIHNVTRETRAPARRGTKQAKLDAKHDD